MKQSSRKSSVLSKNSEATYFEDSEEFFSFDHKYIKHLVWLGISYVAALVILLLDRSLWHKFAYIICAITVFIVLLTFTPLGKTVNGAKAWLGVGGFTLQPMELAKVGISLAVARIMSNYHFSVQRFGDMLIVGLLLCVPLGIAVLQNDMARDLYSVRSSLCSIVRDLTTGFACLQYSLRHSLYSRSYSRRQCCWWR